MAKKEFEDVYWWCRHEGEALDENDILKEEDRDHWQELDQALEKHFPLIKSLEEAHQDLLAKSAYIRKYPARHARALCPSVASVAKIAQLRDEKDQLADMNAAKIEKFAELENQKELFGSPTSREAELETRIAHLKAEKQKLQQRNAAAMTRITHIKAKARRAERKHAWVVRGHVDDIKSIMASLRGEFEEKLWKAEMERLETERKQAEAGTTFTTQCMARAASIEAIDIPPTHPGLLARESSSAAAAPHDHRHDSA